MMKPLLTLSLFALMLAPVSRAQFEPVLFHEDFFSLDNGKPFFFPNIKKHSVFSLEKDDGHRLLKAENRVSASVYKDALKVYDYPKVKWHWKASNVYAMGTIRKQSR